jgi:hypothetical protein
MLRPSENSLIAKKPVFVFVVLNVGGALMATVMYLSGTPSNILLFSTIAALAMLNVITVIMRRMVVADPQRGAEAGFAPPSKKRAWLYLVLGALMMLMALFMIARPVLPSDRPMGFIMVVGSTAFVPMAWKGFRRK